MKDDAVDQLRRQDATGHETDRGDQARKLEIRETEDAMAARAAAGESRAEADEEAAGEHPRELAGVSKTNHLIEQAEIPRRRESAAEKRREVALKAAKTRWANHAKKS